VLRRVILDTNVFIAAAFRPASASGRLVEAVRQGELRLVWDEPTRTETRRLMEKIPPIDWGAVAPLFQEEGKMTGELPDPASFEGVSDPEDRKFAALAAATGTTLVTLDRHLLEGGLEGEVNVVTPTGWWEG